MKEFPKSITVQKDTPSLNQILRDSAGREPHYEGYLDDDIEKISKFHRRFVDLTDLDELRQHVANLSRDIDIREKEVQAEIDAEKAKLLTQDSTPQDSTPTEPTS